MGVVDTDSASGVPGTTGGSAGGAEDDDRDVACDLPGLSADTTSSAVPRDLTGPSTVLDAATAAPLG